MPRRKPSVARAPSTARRRASPRPPRRGSATEKLAKGIAEVEDPPASIQPTTVVVEAIATGVLPEPVIAPEPPEEIPGIESEKMRVGDPDVSPLRNEYSGEEVPGASTPTPDQNEVDQIGRAYGVEEEDTGTLRTSAELLERRDRHRQD
jgi:Family of unknown function (DUF6335)